jgi:Ran GTPase-activating protein (RanGAP) involved in mRNA processing and transport
MADSFDPKATIAEYESSCKAKNFKPNPLVIKSVSESANNRFGIEAPGNDATTFHNRLKIDKLEILTTVFTPKAQFLQRLDLSYNFIDADGVKLLCGMMSGAANLRYLVLTGNEIGYEPCAELLSTVVSAGTELRVLDLSKNPLGTRGGLAVAEFLSKDDLLHELNVEDTKLEIDALIALAAVLHVSNNTLRVLHVSRPSLFTLQEEHVMHFGLMLQMNTGLKQVHLGMHQIYDSGVGVLVHYLVENRTLLRLDLSSNQIGWRGAHSLAVLLQEDCLLEELNLAHNRIGEKAETTGAEQLGRALQQNRSLLRLNVNDNQLCGEALVYLANGVAVNQNIQHVSLFRNQWNQASARRFDRIFADTARISPLEADFYTYQVDGAYHIAQSA